MKTQTDTTLARLRCEYLVDPLGIDETRPRLSWIMESDRRGARQTAWQVRVASSRERLEGGPYEGAPLASRTACHWHVTVWTSAGAPSRVRRPSGRWAC
jgi:alpha-L-rhamnosidase